MRLPAAERARAGMGWVPQERDIFPSLTVEENLLVARRPGEIDLPTVYDLFPRLKERRRNGGSKLSGGEQQMLAIARALMTNPRLLLLDEPFEGLAPVIVDEIEDTMARLRTRFGFAIAIVEQHAEDTLRLSDKAIVLERGRIVLADDAPALLAAYQAQRRPANLLMLAATPGLDRLFSTDNALVRAVRDVGIAGVHRLPGLKRMFMRQAMGG